MLPFLPHYRPPQMHTCVIQNVEARQQPFGHLIEPLLQVNINSWQRLGVPIAQSGHTCDITIQQVLQRRWQAGSKNQQQQPPQQQHCRHLMAAQGVLHYISGACFSTVSVPAAVALT